jgi:hypothetical protein
MTSVKSRTAALVLAALMVAAGAFAVSAAVTAEDANALPCEDCPIAPRPLY